jgi:hypothetical protein
MVMKLYHFCGTKKISFHKYGLEKAFGIIEAMAADE